jgi:hypothetical protein
MSYLAGWPSCNAIGFYSGGVRFESWPGKQQFQLRYFVVFLSPSGKLGQTTFFQTPSKFIFHQSAQRSTLFRLDTESVVKQPTRKVTRDWRKLHNLENPPYVIRVVESG